MDRTDPRSREALVSLIQNGQASVPGNPARSRSDDSWIEVASQPSSSSLSSVADEIITTGLRVQHDTSRRRRRLRQPQQQQQQQGMPSSPTNGHSNGGTSSQEEYEETDSEPDRLMTSSNEGLPHSPLRQEWRPAATRVFSSASSDNLSSNDDDGDDSDENSTAINVPRGNTGVPFTPQPNAFTHPPNHQAPRLGPENPYFTSTQPRPMARGSSQRHSYPSTNPTNHQNARGADHDAALRASLSTLLSCAAAARNLPKSGQTSSSASPPAPNSNRVDTGTLRMVSEEEALGLSPAPGPAPAIRQSIQAGPSGTDKQSKRRTANGQRSNSKDRNRTSKKMRRSSSATYRPLMMDEVSPTLLTWVVSAGVVVLVSALSFSAGYVVGRESGKAEAETTMGAARSCAGEAGRGLRRLRWSGPAPSVRA